MRVGFATDHGGYVLKAPILSALRDAGHYVQDFGAYELAAGDDYPDFVIPLARAVGLGAVQRGIAVCGSGVGASFSANKIRGVRAALIQETFSAHQGVEDDDMNMLCLGGRVVGQSLALEIIQAYLAAHYLGADRFKRRLEKVAALESEE
jgi:ribose 5-phosphate isomerase B